MPMEKDDSDIRVYAKHLQTPSVIHQACIGDWTRRQSDVDSQQPAFLDVVFGKGTYLSLHRFIAEESDQETRPTGSLELIHEQPVFGTIKDIKTLFCDLEPEDDNGAGDGMDVDHHIDRPRLGYLPKDASPMVLVATSDSGVLSFLTFHYEGDARDVGDRGYFYVISEMVIGDPGFDYQNIGAKIAIDPSSRVMAVSALQSSIKLVILRSTTRSQFDPVERVSTIELRGTILGMEFLTPDPDDKDDSAILAILFYNTDTSKHYISTFHISLKNRATGPLTVQVGTSELGSSPLKSVLHIKALPNFPCSMVYIDEEKVTLVTVEKSTGAGAEPRLVHQSSLQLMKKEASENIMGDDATEHESGDIVFPLISACATPPRSLTPLSDQTLYLGSDTSELYRIHIDHLTYAMRFELASGDRPVGGVMQVLARRQITTEPLLSDTDSEIVLNTDYMMYSNDQGDGGILAIKEEEDGIDLFAITELQNSSPVLDFCIHEPTFPGRDSLYVCSGMKGEGSIKRVRSGITAESSGSSGNTFFAGATGLWSIKENQQDDFDSFLVVSFIQSTKVMRRGEEGSLEDMTDNCGFDPTQATVYAGRLKDGTIFQVHRSGVIAVKVATAERHIWSAGDGVIASAYRVADGIVLLGQILAGSSSLLVLELAQSEPSDELQAPPKSFRTVASTPLRAEPTAIHCWQENANAETMTEADESDKRPSDIFCCVGTLEPAVLIYQIMTDTIRDVYTESLAQSGRESVTIPHSICVLKGQGRQCKVLVSLRDGSVIAYDWSRPLQQQSGSLSTSIRALSLPRLYKLGIMPGKFAFTHDATLSRTLVLSDKLWHAFLEQELEFQPILFDSEVSQACSFQSGDEDLSSKQEYIFIVDHDMQLISLDAMHKYNYQTITLGLTPRRVLNVTSKGLLLVACVGEGFPFAESTLQLIDPERVSNEPSLRRPHVVAEFALRQGEAVFCLAEWRIRRPNKSDAVYICVGTGLFSPTGTETTAAVPKMGRLVVLSIKQSKKSDRKTRKFELDLRWAMAMPAPVYAISTFMDMLVEKASHRERWPIVQISSSGSMVCTGSRRETITFYEYQEGINNERSFDKLRFLKSAYSTRMVSDCIAISPEFAIGVDMSGGIFGVGNPQNEPSHQNSLVDRFSFHVGEVMSRIRLAKIWPAQERSLSGIALSQRTSDTEVTAEETNQMQMDQPATLTQGDPEKGLQNRPLTLSQKSLSAWILLPWTAVDNALHSAMASTTFPQLTQSSSETVRPSSQALVACTLIGSILGFWRLRPQVYLILNTLESILQQQSTYECRPVLSNKHDRYRSLSSPRLFTIDGNLMDRFLQLDHTWQVQLLRVAVGLDRIMEDWIQQSGMSAQEREYLSTVPSHQRLVHNGATEVAGCLVHKHPGKDHDLCRTVFMICHILTFLRSLDWHQQ
ncbi:hypothetical protein BGZ51_001298 [Haplosporangium sp. Z 767]|nr:hypothetical protein BGZ51_001298 [Haplosporangium sp. Z 767]KAF9189142.1 hypothetical protein BGZ50_000931 [Haplosporangium sp. Z 11]